MGKAEIKIDGEPNKNNGEILLKSRTIMVGYFKKEAESRNTITPDG